MSAEPSPHVSRDRRSEPPARRRLSFTNAMVGSMTGLVLGLVAALLWTPRLGIAVGVIALIAAILVPIVAVLVREGRRGRHSLGSGGAGR